MLPCGQINFPKFVCFQNALLPGKVVFAGMQLIYKYKTIKRLKTLTKILKSSFFFSMKKLTEVYYDNFRMPINDRTQLN